MNQISKSHHFICWLIVAASVFAVDIASKWWIHLNFDLYESINILPIFSITYVRNIGAAFSLFGGMRWLLAVVAIVISLVIIYLLYKNRNGKKWESFSLALILGGALGNLFDRLYHGFVIDFLDFYFKNWHYPTFNIADCAICLGVALFLFHSFKMERKNRS